MKAHFELKSLIREIGNKSHDSYKSIEGTYLFNNFVLFIEFVQKDSNDPPGRFRIKIDQEIAKFPPDIFSNRTREIALRDFLTRSFCDAVTEFSSDEFISFEYPGQEILERSSVFVDSSFVEVRFEVTLQTSGNILSNEDAEDFLFKRLPQIVQSSLIFDNLEEEALYKHIETSEDADFLRNELENLRLIAFVAEDSSLPRGSKSSSLPMATNAVTAFSSPERLKMDVELPNKGQITGMGIPRGITFITGEKNHGKSTLLDAIQMGIYNHIPGDGREFVVSNPNSVKVRSEEGRSINNLDISAFLPTLEVANCYSTVHADNITSEAANIIESIEIGADVLLLDEDTSAPGFLLKILEKVENNSKETASLIPYIEKAKSLFREYMISTIMVIENPQGFYEEADFVVRMKHKKAEEITLEIKNDGEHSGTNDNFGFIQERIPCFDNMADLREQDIIVNEDMRFIEQIVSISQLNTIGKAIEYSKKYMDGKKTFRQVTSLVMLDIGRAGLDVLDPNLRGDYAEFRKIELFAALNRLNSLKVKQK